MAKKTKRNLTAPKKEGKSRALAILSPTLVPVDFYGDQLYFVDEDGCWVPIRPIVEALNLSWSRQRKKIKEDPVLATVVAQWATQVESNNQKRLRTYIKLDYLNGWLFKINPNKIPDPTARERVIRYQRECYEVLSRHYQTHLVFKSEVLAKLPDTKSRKGRKMTFGRCHFNFLGVRSPELAVGNCSTNIVTGKGHCFACNARWNLASLYAKKLGISYDEARREPARESSPSAIANGDPLEIALERYRGNYRTNSKAGDYAAARGLLSPTVEQFEIGYAMDSWTDLLTESWENQEKRPWSSGSLNAPKPGGISTTFCVTG